MSATTLDSPQPSFATSAELAALRTEVAELRRQVAELRAANAAPDWQHAMARLQAGYDALSDEAKAIHKKSEAEAKAVARGCLTSDG